MKLRKYIGAALAAVAGLFVSCSNDEITFAYESQVTVNSSSVISSFEPWKVGDLELLSDGYRLRTRLLIYDAEGSLVGADSVLLNNWTSPAQLHPRLAPGTYTVYAISDVVKHNGSKMTLEYWQLTDRDKLATVKLKDTGWLGGKRKIMGIGSQKLQITENGGSAAIDVKPAGALFLIYLVNIHQYSDVTELEIAVQKTGDYLTFDERGNYTAAFKSDGTSYTAYRIMTVNPKDFTNNNVYGYEFELPTKNYSLKFKVNYKNSSSGNTNYIMSPGFYMDLEPGTQWWYAVDLAELENNFAEECFLMNGDAAVKPEIEGAMDWSKPQFMGKRKSVYLTEFE